MQRFEIFPVVKTDEALVKVLKFLDENSDNKLYARMLSIVAKHREECNSLIENSLAYIQALNVIDNASDRKKLMPCEKNEISGKSTGYFSSNFKI